MDFNKNEFYTGNFDDTYEEKIDEYGCSDKESDFDEDCETCDSDFESFCGRIDKYVGKESRVVIPGRFETIGFNAFENCDTVKSVVIKKPEPDAIFKGIKEILCSAFENCKNLEEIIISDEVNKIWGSAFNGCTSLKKINIPDGVNEISAWLFCDCSSIEELILPNNISELGMGAFYGCTSLKEINIPKNVSEIPEMLFKNCSSLKKFDMHNNIKSIRDNAFNGCTALEYVFIPSAVTEIGEGILKNTHAFICSDTADCYAKEYADENYIEFKVLDSEGNFKTVQSKHKADDQGFVIENNILIKYLGKNEDITIPDNVTEIANGAFKDCKTLINVVIPGSVKKIGEEAFYWSSVNNITLCNGIKEIGELAFGLCNGLSVIEFPESVEYIGKDVMEDCQELEKIIIHNKSAVIGESAFSGCISAVDKKGFLIIDNRLFRYMDDVTNDEVVNIPDGVRKIDGYAFVGAEIAKTYVLPQSVETISGSAFEYCDGIENIEISNNNVDIHPDAFKGIENLTVFAHEGSNAEKFAKENGYKFEMVLTDEQKAAIKLAEEMKRKSEYDALVTEKEQLLKTIAENKGLFGEKARRRKEAKAKLAEVETKMNNYPEFNK